MSTLPAELPRSSTFLLFKLGVYSNYPSVVHVCVCGPDCGLWGAWCRVVNVKRHNVWSGKVAWCLCGCWLIYDSSCNYKCHSCVPFLLVNFDTLQLMAIWTLFFTAVCLIASIPVMCRMIAAHVKYLNIFLFIYNHIPPQSEEKNMLHKKKHR